MTKLVPNPAAATPEKLQFVGGALCLDFCNSVGGKRGVRTREYLNSYLDFLSWCDQAGLIENSPSKALLRKAARQPAEAAVALSRAITLREAIYRIFLAVAEQEQPAGRDLALLNAELGRSLNRLRVMPVKNGFGWEWGAERGALDHALGPIARSAADLLTSGDSRAHVRQCQGDNCGWLFIDSSKNHSRCWCDMRDCGNRAKVRRHRLRKRMVNKSF
jgi:predicted RNA-binding Zn ribbon-like protein